MKLAVPLSSGEVFTDTYFLFNDSTTHAYHFNNIRNDIKFIGLAIFRKFGLGMDILTFTGKSDILKAPSPCKIMNKFN